MTRRDRSGPPDPEAYWRRRFIILGGGLSALMLAAWAFGSGGPSPAASRTAAARASMAARESRTSLPSTAYGSAWTPSAPASSPAPAAGRSHPKGATTATRTAKGAATASPSATPSGAGAHGGPGASARASAGGHGDAGATAGPRGAQTRCARGSVVLSLFTSAPAYRPAQEPQFDVYAVSTASSACEMPFGPEATRIVVTHDGRVVWDSASCKASSPGSAQAPSARFTQGVPQEATLSWNRAAASQGCAGSLTHGESGTFDAVAMADGIASNVRAFTLKP